MENNREQFSTNLEYNKENRFIIKFLDDRFNIKHYLVNRITKPKFHNGASENYWGVITISFFDPIGGLSVTPELYKMVKLLQSGILKLNLK